MMASLSFIADLPLYRSLKPFEIIGLSKEEVPDEHKTNIVYETHDTVSISDARTTDEALSLETCGFSWVQHRSFYVPDITPFVLLDESHIVMQKFLQETIEVAQKILSASHVFIYDWRVSKK
jgi:hypothetical protein